MSDDGRRAFKLVDEISLDELQGASMAYGPLGHFFDIKEALVAGKGVITTNDPTLIGTLAGADCLQPADVPADATLAVLPFTPEVVEQDRVSYTPQEPVDTPEAVFPPEAATTEEAVAQGEPAPSAPTSSTSSDTATASPDTTLSTPDTTTADSSASTVSSASTASRR